MTVGEGRAVGVSRPRPDGPEKVRGAVRYGADRPMHGLLHARLVPSLAAHARIVSIDASAALAIPGVVAVLTADDLPTRSRAGDRMARPLARGEVVFAGQPVALVVAESEAAAADAVELVDVTLDRLPIVLDPEAAMAPEAPLVRGDLAEAAEGALSADAQTHASVGGGGEDELGDEDLSANVVGRHHHASGDVDGAIDGASITVSGRFTTSWVYQGYLEPWVCTAWVDADGTLVVESGTQGAFGARNDVSKALGLPVHSIRVVPTPLGGAFGGKWSLFESLAGAAALAVGRPVRLALTRSEDLLAGNPSQAFVIDLTLAADADGRFRGLRSRIVADGGAFADASVESLAAILIAGPYVWPAWDIRAYGVRTNRFGVGAYRGPSGPPTSFALESLVDELADRLGMDPLALRRLNGVGDGSVMPDREPWPRIGLAEVLDAMESVPWWREWRAGQKERRGGRATDMPPTAYPATTPSPTESIGVGVAVACWPGATEPAAAACRISTDGTIQIVTGVVDMSGTAGGFQNAVAEVLGVAPGSVTLVTADTGSAPPSPGSGGSTITYSAGRAIRAAADDARRQILAAAALELEIAESDLELVDGGVRPKGTPGRSIPLAKLARAHQRRGGAPIEGHASTSSPSLAPSVAGHVVRVRVDRETGEVDVLDHHVVQDVGRALNPALVTDQQHGAAVQTLGWGLREALVHDEAGQLRTGSFLDYALPRVDDVGHLANTIVEVPAPDGPFGAKGMGEAPVLAGAAAIANAVAAATGVRLRDLPMTPPRVWRAIEQRSG